MVWDQEGAVGQWPRGTPVLTASFDAFRGLLGTSVRLCRPRRPQAKGLVERNNDYYERSFLPGRSFTSPTDFNARIAEWITARANVTSSPQAGLPADPTLGGGQGGDAAAAAGSTRRRMATLAAPSQGPLRASGYQRLLGGPAHGGSASRGHADLHQVQVFAAGRLVADHERCWAAHQTITDTRHAQAAVALRQQSQRHRPEVDPLAVEVRDLYAYDRAFGIDDGQVA